MLPHRLTTPPALRAPRARSWLCTALTVAVLYAPARAQEPAAPPATPSGPADEYGRGMPSSTWRGLLDACQAPDYARAVEYLDLRALRKAERQMQGTVLARHICTIIDRKLPVSPEVLSDAPEGDTSDGLLPRHDRVGIVTTEKGPVEILLERVPRPDGPPIWKISSTTVAQIPALYEEFGYGPLGEWLPGPLVEIRFLQVQLWQWIGLGILLVVAVVTSLLITRLLAWLLRPLLARLRDGVDHEVEELLVGPVRLGIAVAVLYSGALLLALSAPAQLWVGDFAKGLSILSVTWLTLRLVDVGGGQIEAHLFRRGQASVVAMLPLVRRSAKAVLLSMAALALLQNFGFNVTGLLAGLGVGGLAIALAAQETVKNLFGGVTLIADQPVRVGDLCRFGDRTGTVEDISLWSTRIRTFDRSVVSIPNGQFASMQIENFARRDRIRLNVTLGLRYGTAPEQLRVVLSDLKKMLLAHPKVHPEPARVRFVRFGASSLDIELFAYVVTFDYDEFLAIQEELLLQIMDIVKESGSEFAVPAGAA